MCLRSKQHTWTVCATRAVYVHTSMLIEIWTKACAAASLHARHGMHGLAYHVESVKIARSSTAQGQGRSPVATSATAAYPHFCLLPSTKVDCRVRPICKAGTQAFTRVIACKPLHASSWLIQVLPAWLRQRQYVIACKQVHNADGCKVLGFVGLSAVYIC